MWCEFFSMSVRLCTNQVFMRFLHGLLCELMHEIFGFAPPRCHPLGTGRWYAQALGNCTATRPSPVSAQGPYCSLKPCGVAYLAWLEDVSSALVTMRLGLLKMSVLAWSRCGDGGICLRAGRSTFPAPSPALRERAGVRVSPSTQPIRRYPSLHCSKPLTLFTVALRLCRPVGYIGIDQKLEFCTVRSRCAPKACPADRPVTLFGPTEAPYSIAKTLRFLMAIAL